MKKKLIIIILVVVMIAFCALLIFFTAFGGYNLFSHIPEPKIKYGEFPFELTYEINGNRKSINDTIVCEFDGFEVIGEAGKYRKWKSYLKSGNEDIVLMNLRENNEQNELEQSILELFFYWGNAEYYMGDYEDGRGKKAQDFDWIEYKFKTNDGQIGGSAYRNDEAFEKYGIKLIEWKVAEPIKNSFE